MSATGIDAAKDIVTLLDANWTTANTDDKKPTVRNFLEKAWEDIEFGTSDFLYVKYDLENIKTGLYAADFFHRIACSIEVITSDLGNTSIGRLHFEKVIEEVARIIKANPRQTGYASTLLKNTRARYAKDRGIFIGSLDVELLKVRTT